MINFWDYSNEYKFLKNKNLISKIDESLASGKIFYGKQLQIFEKNFLKFNQSKYGIAVKTGTDALILALMASNIKSGDEVITVSLTAIPTISAIISVGAKPVFIDVNQYCLIDEKKIIKKITKNTKAIIPVHLYGKTCNMDLILEIAKKYKLTIIEDCAQSLGSKYKKKKSGNFGDFGCYSFYPTKILGAYGDGGFIVCKDKKKLNLLKQLSFYGLETNNTKHSKYKKYYANIHGINSRIDNIQASILNLKLKFLKRWIRKRQLLAKIYSKTLFKIKSTNKDHVFHLYVIRCKLRNKLIKYLKTKKINVGIHYECPTHKMNPYKKFKNKNTILTNSEKYSKEIISLPMHPFLNLKIIKKVTKEINNFNKKFKNEIKPTF